MERRLLYVQRVKISEKRVRLGHEFIWVFCCQHKHLNNNNNNETWLLSRLQHEDKKCNTTHQFKKTQLITAVLWKCSPKFHLISTISGIGLSQWNESHRKKMKWIVCVRESVKEKRKQNNLYASNYLFVHRCVIDCEEAHRFHLRKE